jgi:hypothetical protein
VEFLLQGVPASWSSCFMEFLLPMQERHADVHVGSLFTVGETPTDLASETQALQPSIKGNSWLDIINTSI